MEDTQAINWEVEEEEETERSSDSLGSSLEPLGRLHIFSSVHGPEKDFPLYLGKNVVGRTPDCSVALPFPSISKQHAVIEILGWNKAPILQDCGSLNGTQIMRPPKFLSPGVSHRLRDQELVIFADLLCQYHRLEVSLPFVSRGPLTVEETPRVQGKTQSGGILLAEDSEEEVDPLSERCTLTEPRTTFSHLATVVPESDEEGPPSPPNGPGPPRVFHFDSDTDEEESPQPAAGEPCSATTRDAIVETGKHKAVTTEIQCEKDQYSGKERNNDTRAETDMNNRVVPVGVILERSQPSGEDSETDVDDESRPLERPAEARLDRVQPSAFIDSDTDMEEEGVPMTPAVVPMKKRQVFQGVITEKPGGPHLAHLQESLADSDTDVETEAPQEVPLEHRHASMIISSSTDDSEEVSAALTLAHLKESQATVWNREIGVEEDRVQPLSSLEQSQTSAGRDSDTNVEEKREYVPKGHTDKAHSEKSNPPFRDRDEELEEDKNSPGVHLERSQASATVGFSTHKEEEAPPGPAVTLTEKPQAPVAWTNQSNVEEEGGQAKQLVVHLDEAQPPPGRSCGTDADVRKSQLPAEEDARTEWVVPVLQQERALEVGAQGGSPVAQVEQDHLLVSRKNLTDLLGDTGILGESSQPERKGPQPPRGNGRDPHVDMTKDSGDNRDDSENLDLEATQCFVGNQHMEAAQSTEGEPTQAFLLTLPQEPGPSHGSSLAPGALDEPWEVLATQPFCLRELEASNMHLEAHGSCPLSPRTTPQDQHPESPLHAESLGVQGHLNCKMSLAEKISRGDPESLEAPLPATAPEASATAQNPFIRHNRECPAPQLLFSPSPPSVEPPIPRTRQNEQQEVLENPLFSELDLLHAKPKVRPQGCSRMTPPPVNSIALESHLSTSKEQPEPISQATRGRTHRSSVKTPEPIVSTAPELQPSSSKDHPVTPELTSRATRGRTHRSSVKTSKPIVPTALELQASTSKDHPLTPESTSRATRGRTHRSSVKTSKPIVPTALELQASTSKDHPLTPESTSRATQGRTHRSSVKTPKPVVSTAPELQASTSKDHLVTPESTSRATRGRTHGSSVKTPEPIVPTAPELQLSISKDQPVTPEPTPRATRGRTHGSSVKTPESVVPTAPELQLSTSKDQPVTPEPASRATRGRTHRSSIKTPEPIVPTAPELQLSTSKDQPVTPESTSWATRGRRHGSSVKTPEPIVPTAPELQLSTSKDQPVSSEPTSRATRGRRHGSSVKTPEPIVPTAPELQLSTSKDQLVTAEPTSRATRGRTHRSSVKTPEPIVPTAPELQLSTSKDQPATSETESWATQGRTYRSSVKTHQATEPTALDLGPPTPADQPVTLAKAIAHGGWSRSLRSTRNAVPVPTIPELQSLVPAGQLISLESVPQANCSRKPRATRKHSSLTTPTSEPCPAPLEPNSLSSRNQRRGVARAAKSLRTIPEPTFAQLPEASTHCSQIQKVEAAGRQEFTPETQPKALQSCKRPSGTVGSPPLQKRLQRGEISQKTVFLKEEEDPMEKEEGIVTPGPSKRKKDQAENEPKGMPGRSHRRTNPKHKSTAPRVGEKAGTSWEQVLFTGVVDGRGEHAVLALGGSLASSAAEASHLVTDRIRRTVKFLCALGRGIPILSLDWLHQSHKAGCFLPPDEYVVMDSEQEKNFGFSLRDSLSRAREQRLLEGYEIHVTPGVQPPPAQMAEIISCCGGTVLPSMPRSYKPQRVVITCSQDVPLCSGPIRAGLPLLSTEFLLTGVLKQEAKPEAFVLSTLEMPST